jgi:hypothetical protein
MELCGAVTTKQVLQRRNRGREMWAKGRDDGYLQEKWKFDWWRILAFVIVVGMVWWLANVTLLFRDKEGNEFDLLTVGLLGLKWKPAPEVDFPDFA